MPGVPISITRSEKLSKLADGVGPRVRLGAAQGEIHELATPEGWAGGTTRPSERVTRMLGYGKTNGDFAVYHLLLTPSPFTSPTTVSGAYV